MENSTQKTEVKKPTPQRKLSFFRLLVLILVIVAGMYYVANNWRDLEETVIGNVIEREANQWFAPYVDVTATPQYEFEKLGATPAKNVVLSFIVSSSSDPCIPTWGNAYTLDRAGTYLDLDRRIARLRQQGGDIAVSFGGLLNDELAIKCTDAEKLLNAYKSVVERYSVYTLDFDIEGEALNNTEANNRRATVLAQLQKELREQNKNLAIWLTLPVIPDGLTESGTNTVASMLSNGVDLAGVNVMTMNYGESKKGQSMKASTERALIETHRQLGILYKQAGINLSNKSLWKKIGATPMIGQNDISSEVFTLEDAKNLAKYALNQGIIRVSMWSANRDIQCGENYVNTTVVSDSCSGVSQEKLSFTYALGEDFKGTFSQSLNSVTTEDLEKEENIVDDPENSPYRIWSENDVYLEGTKVVWKRNVYQAKWWTQGDSPDNPVLQSWQTPWQLVGPVLPGEKPVKQATLPEGTYPTWSGTAQYEAGSRVLFNGVPYQAKWWTQGDSPSAAISNPTSSPWVALTAKQIDEILQGK
jgi:chitinase